MGKSHFLSPLIAGFCGFVAQKVLRPAFPYPQTHLSHGFRNGDAKRGVAVQDGSADMEFSNLTVEVACHEALPQQLHAMHLRLGAASAVVSAPRSPDGAAKVFRGA